LHDTVIINPLLCNQNCNQTCCDKKTENKFNQTKCEKCGSTNGKYGNKYSIKNEIPSTTTQEIITAHPTTASSSSYSYISYGCVIFDVAGDIYFNITNNSAQKCVEECLIKDKNFQFFITSFFGG
jgi:hypothetical protein